MALSYDRRVSECLLSALEIDGWAHSLVEYGRACHYALDLQLRAYKGDSWATLYVGTTKVLDLHGKGGPGSEKFKLYADPSYQSGPHGWSSTWTTWHSAHWWTAEWPNVDNYLHRVIPTIKAGFLVEGIIQCAASRVQHKDMRIVDREATVAFPNKPTRTTTLSALRQQLMAAVEPLHGHKWWTTKPKSLGPECDLLAVTKHGELMAIEVKPKNATAAITWSALQVAMYTMLFNMWLEQSAGHGAEVLTGMVQQRARVDLLPPGFEAHFGPDIPVRRAVAIGHRCSQTAIDRLREVDACLVGANLGLPPLEVYEAKLSGFDQHPLW